MSIAGNNLSETRRGTTEALSPPSRWTWRLVVAGLACYVLTSAIPLLGGLAGFSFISSGRSIPYGKTELLLRFAAWDGGQYAEVVEQGYSYNPGHESTVAFFPAYPLLARGVACLTGWSSWAALLAVSNLSLALSFVLFVRFASLRFPDAPEITAWSTLAFGLFPTTFYFRMAYSESLFLLLCLTTLYGIERRWSVWLLAFIAGACSAVRPVGVALMLPVFLYILQIESPPLRRWIKISLGALLSAWGLLAYMAYLWQTFGDPLAFVEAQGNFWLRSPVHFLDWMPRVIVLEPIWGNYLPKSDAFWRQYSPRPMALFNLQFANPIYFVVFAGLLAIGWSKQRINSYEGWLALALLMIPYTTRSYVYCMASQGRFAAVAIPVYLILGCFLSRVPVTVAGSILGVWSIFLGIYAAMFASWYFFV